MGRGKELGELIRIRTLSFLRESEAVFWTFVFPVVLAVVLGLAFQAGDSSTTKIGIVSGHVLEVTPDGAELAEFPAEDAGLARLRSGAIDALLSGDADSGDPRIYYDPRRPESELALRQLAGALEGESGPRAAAIATPIEETGARYIDFLLPGLIGMTLMGSGVWGVGFAIVDTRQRKLLKRMLVTPMRRSSFLLSLMISRVLFLIPEVALLVVFGSLIMGVPMRGSILALGVVSLAGSLCFASLGLLIASRARTIEGVSGLMNLALLPLWLCGGIFFSYERFPEAVHPLIRASPLAPLNDALRAVMLEGQGLVQVLPETATVAGWGVVSFIIALKIFRWQ